VKNKVCLKRLLSGEHCHPDMEAFWDDYHILLNTIKAFGGVLERISETDISEDAGIVWLTQWRNETKEVARRVLDESGYPPVEGK
jgi:hypothetical protein